PRARAQRAPDDRPRRRRRASASRRLPGAGAAQRRGAPRADSRTGVHDPRRRLHVTLGPHTAVVRDEVVRLLERTTAPATRAVLGELADELDRPLRLAVTGRVNAGKSTLVNALLRQRIAPTDVSECTRYASWFRFGTPERVEVVGPDGTRRPVQLRPDGRLPASLGDLCHL